MAQFPRPRLVLIKISVLAENLTGDTMGTGTTAPVPPPRGEVSERSAEVVDELVALRLCEDEATADAAAVNTGTTSTLPTLLSKFPATAAAAEAADELDVPLPVSPPSSSTSVWSESDESPVNGVERICPARCESEKRLVKN